MSPAPFGYSSVELAGFLDGVSRRATRLHDNYEGRTGSLDAGELSSVLSQLADERDAMARAEQYVQLRLAQDPSDKEGHALREVVRQTVRRIRGRLSFLALEWTALPEETADRFLAAAELTPYRAYLEELRAFRQHTLSASEENILRRKSLTSRQYWQDLYNDRSTRIQVTLGDGEVATLNAAIGHLFDPDSGVRRHWWFATVSALQVDVDVRWAAIRALIADKAADDAIRSYPTWMTARQVANGLTDELVQNTIAASQRCLPLAHRFYACGRAVLGVEQLYPWDLDSIVEGGATEIPWRQAREILKETFNRLSSRFAQPLLDILDGGCVDAEARPGKQPTGFTSLGTPSTQPYVSVNYLGRPRDVLTLAHEVAHAVHACLSGGQNMLCFRPPTLLTEAFAALAEIQATHVLAERLDVGSGRAQLAMMCLEGCARGLCYPAANHVFEAEAHRLFRSGSPIDANTLGDLWHQTRRSLYGDAVEEVHENRWWWTRLPHWTAPTGYWFGYCFGHLLALHLWWMGRKPGVWLSRVLPDVLSTGSSMSQVDQLQLLGVRPSDPAVWRRAVETIEGWVAESEFLISGREEKQPHDA